MYVNILEAQKAEEQTQVRLEDVSGPQPQGEGDDAANMGEPRDQAQELPLSPEQRMPRRFPAYVWPGAHDIDGDSRETPAMVTWRQVSRSSARFGFLVSRRFMPFTGTSGTCDGTPRQMSTILNLQLE